MEEFNAETVRRINELARSLHANKLAIDMNDAVEKAKDIIKIDKRYDT